MFSFCELKTVLNSAHLKKDTWGYQKDTPAVFFVGFGAPVIEGGTTDKLQVISKHKDTNTRNTKFTVPREKAKDSNASWFGWRLRRRGGHVGTG